MAEALLMFIEAQGLTIEEMRRHAQASPLYQRGDMQLIWVNSGDLVEMQMKGWAFEAPTIEVEQK